MTIKKLSAMPYAQAHIEIDDDHNKHLFSYVTRVASLSNDGWLTVYGLHSMTTRKHIGAFMREYTDLSYDNAKGAYEGNYRLNVYTGEVEELAQANSVAPGPIVKNLTRSCPGAGPATCTKTCAEICESLCILTIDKAGLVWYNICVR